MPYYGLGSSPQNYGPNAALTPAQGGPVRRRPGMGMTGQFARQDEMARLAQGDPSASPMATGSTADAMIGSRNDMRTDAMAPDQPQVSTVYDNGGQNWWQQPIGGMEFGSGIPAPQHRARGGNTRRTRYLDPGTAEVPYGNRGQSMVTGGTGAAPALPGRIGYRGALTAEAPTGSGIDWLNQGRTQGFLNAGSRNEIDPVTGLSVNPTENEINSQLRMIAGQGDEAGLEGQGLGGSRRTAALARYYDARKSGDPNEISAATQGVQDLKRTIDTTRQISKVPFPGGPAMDLTPQGPTAAIQPSTPGQTVPEPYDGTKPSVGADEEQGVKDQMAQDALPKKDGGPVADVHPYIVNEEGPEAFKPDGEKPVLMPGPEHMTTFSKDGTVIPHGRTMRMMQEGKIQMPEHRGDGGATEKTWWNRPLFPDKAPINSLIRAPGRLAQRLSAEAKYPFMGAEIPKEFSHPGLQLPPQDQVFNQPTGDEYTSSQVNAPVAHVEPEWDDQPNVPVASQGNWLSSLLDNIRSPAQQAEQHAAQNVVAADNATQSIMGNRGVERIGALPGQDRSFLTPYGTAGVKFKAGGGKVNRTRMLAKY